MSSRIHRIHEIPPTCSAGFAYWAFLLIAVGKRTVPHLLADSWML